MCPSCGGTCAKVTISKYTVGSNTPAKVNVSSFAPAKGVNTSKFSCGHGGIPCPDQPTGGPVDTSTLHEVCDDGHGNIVECDTLEENKPWYERLWDTTKKSVAEWWGIVSAPALSVLKLIFPSVDDTTLTWMYYGGLALAALIALSIVKNLFL